MFHFWLVVYLYFYSSLFGNIEVISHFEKIKLNFCLFTVPIEKKEECGKNMRYPPQYGLKNQSLGGPNGESHTRL